jgi:integrase
MNAPVNKDSIPADKTIVQIFLEGKKPATRNIYDYSLKRIARHLGTDDYINYPWQELRNKDVSNIRSWLLAQGESSYAATTMAALKGILETCYDNELITDANDYIRAVKACKIKVDQKPRPAAGRMLSPEEIAALLKTCMTGPRKRGTRDAAIIMLFAGCGLRRAEITTLTMKDFDPETGRLLVHGKGGKSRTNYVVNGVASAMSEWLKIRGSEWKDEHIFLSIYQTDELFPRAISRTSVWEMLKNRMKQAGLKNFTPHDLRRTFISNMIPLTDLVTVSQLVGHGRPEVTAGYDRRNETHKEDAAALLHIPFEKRGEL